VGTTPSMPTRAGYHAGAVGQASLPFEAPVKQPPTLQELKLRWISRLEERAPAGRSWAHALKQCWVGAVGWKSAHEFCTTAATLTDFKFMIQRTGACWDQAEGMRVYHSWAADDGTLSFAAVLGDLEREANRAAGPSKPVFAIHAQHGSLEKMPIPGSRSRSNLESEDSSLVLRATHAVAVSPATPPPAQSERLHTAGVAAVTGGTTNNGSSVEGGIFGSAFLGPQPVGLRGEQTLAPAGAGNVRNLPSVEGGIFADHSGGKPVAPNVVPNNSIWGRWGSPSQRAQTVEYGYSAFPRQGLDVLNAQRVRGFDPVGQ